jgi:hypothetical protein
MLPRLMCAALVFTFLWTAASAEKERPRTESPEPELRIRLVLAPVVFPPRHKDGDRERDEGAVNYNLSPSVDNYSVTQETRPMLLDGLKHEQVRLTTVVLK